MTFRPADDTGRLRVVACCQRIPLSRHARSSAMAYAGQVIENPVSGEKLTFIQTAAETNGELLELELELTPDGHVPGAHQHPEQTETFHVLEGTMKFRLG